jgi:hypothetical protein
MPKFRVRVRTVLMNEVVVEAKDFDEAERIGLDQVAAQTLNDLEWFERAVDDVMEED